MTAQLKWLDYHRVGHDICPRNILHFAERDAGGVRIERRHGEHRQCPDGMDGRGAQRRYFGEPICRHRGKQRAGDGRCERDFVKIVRVLTDRELRGLELEAG